MIEWTTDDKSDAVARTINVPGEWIGITNRAQREIENLFNVDVITFLRDNWLFWAIVQHTLRLGTDTCD